MRFKAKEEKHHAHISRVNLLGRACHGRRLPAAEAAPDHRHAGDRHCFGALCAEPAGPLHSVHLRRPAPDGADYHPAESWAFPEPGRPEKSGPSRRAYGLGARQLRDSGICAAGPSGAGHHPDRGRCDGSRAGSRVPGGGGPPHGSADGGQVRHGQEHSPADNGRRLLRRHLRHCALFHLCGHGSGRQRPSAGPGLHSRFHGAGHSSGRRRGLWPEPVFRDRLRPQALRAQQHEGNCGAGHRLPADGCPDLAGEHSVPLRTAGGGEHGLRP